MPALHYSAIATALPSLPLRVCDCVFTCVYVYARKRVFGNELSQERRILFPGLVHVALVVTWADIDAYSFSFCLFDFPLDF